MNPERDTSLLLYQYSISRQYVRQMSEKGQAKHLLSMSLLMIKLANGFKRAFKGRKKQCMNYLTSCTNEIILQTL